MKKSELRKIIKEEVLKELNIKNIQRMNGLVNNRDSSIMLKAAGSILTDLINEGFDSNDVRDYIIGKITRFLK